MWSTKTVSRAEGDRKREREREMQIDQSHVKNKSEE
jgi:hypothetical protein